jgi:hypothetical protein
MLELGREIMWFKDIPLGILQVHPVLVAKIAQVLYNNI